jgi:S-adenosylmethionine-diacylglycerol 3-amino-3-carboxypropyl transferase
MSDAPSTLVANPTPPLSTPVVERNGSQITHVRSEAAQHADFTQIRYAQCWEDADVLVEGLGLRPGTECLSIASAGDNTLALLTRHPQRVVALDLNPAQLACLELRVAAYRELDHPELLELIGSRPSHDRSVLYQRCRSLLSPAVRAFWDARPAEVQRGIGHAGKFERYFETFRQRVLPLIHSRQKVKQLLVDRSPSERLRFYKREWNTWRWRLVFRVFFSRFVMGRCGRDPSFFRYVQGSVATRILGRAEHALTKLNPAGNAYLGWILRGGHGDALPMALRREHFDTIRKNLDRLEWHCQSVETFLDRAPEQSFDAFNLSDIFEYMSASHHEALLRRIARVGRSGARLVYWNTLVDRRRPESLAKQLRSLPDLSQRLHGRDQAFFYCAMVVEEVI